MSSDINKIKGHPGFMPFGCSNVKSGTSDTQSSREKKISAQEIASDKSKTSK